MNSDRDFAAKEKIKRTVDFPEVWCKLGETIWVKKPFCVTTMIQDTFVSLNSVRSDLIFRNKTSENAPAKFQLAAKFKV
jgi:hypothetical protein